ncbi:MAG: histidine phosphatase family protein [Ginsengibacter sp.]
MDIINQSSSPHSSGDKGKTLILIRHAKSSWDNNALTDFDRPLNERGKKDAPVMAKRLMESRITIDAFISSPAKRAKKTAEFFIKEFGRKEKEIIFIPELYEASVETFYHTVLQIDNALSNIAIFSHNPGITFFANTLTSNTRLDNMPTCSVFAVKSNIKKWSYFRDSEKEFWFFDYPKKGQLTGENS